MSHSNRKICTKCKIEQPLSRFSKDKTIPDGLAVWCRACRAQWKAVNEPRGKRHFDHSTLEGTSSAYCCDCKTIMRYSDFHFDKTGAEGLSYICKACKAVRNQEYRRRKRGLVNVPY